MDGYREAIQTDGYAGYHSVGSWAETWHVGCMLHAANDGIEVHKGMKAGDIDPKGTKEHCYIISDKSRAIAGGVMEAIFSHFNR